MEDRRTGPGGGGAADAAKAFAALVDLAVSQRHQPAVDFVTRLREERPTADPEELTEQIIRRYRRELATLAAVTGGAAAAPVTGRMAGFLAYGADAALTVARLGEMVQAIALVHGHTEADLEERRQWVASVLTLANVGTAGIDRLATAAGIRGGARVLARLGTAAGRLPLGRLPVAKGAKALAIVVPLGIGAGVGAVGNSVLTTAVGRAAREYFRDPELRARADRVGEDVLDGDITIEVIDVEALEVIDLPPDPGPPGGRPG